MLFSSSGKNTSQYRLKVTAGPEYDPSTHQTVPVNAEKALHIENEHAIINLRVRIQDYTGLPNNSPKTSPYFTHPLHKHDQYSICFSFIPKHDVSGDDLVFGNDFDRPIRDRLPPGFNTALRIVRWAIDPALDGDPYADKPYMYSPGLASWNWFRVGRKVGLEAMKRDKERWLNQHHGDEEEGEEEEEEEEEQDTQIVEEGADDDEAQEWRDANGVPDHADQRKKHFLEKEHRERFVFERGRMYVVDFANPYIGFSDFSLRLPGFSIRVTRYIDEKNHELRYTLKNRRTNETYLIVLFTLLLHDSHEDSDESLSAGPSSGNSSDIEKVGNGTTNLAERNRSPRLDDVD